VLSCRAEASASSGGEGAEDTYVAGFVAGIVDRRFGDEGAVSEARVAQQAAEGRGPDGAFADVLVTVEFGTHRGLGVVAMPDADRVESDGGFDQLGGFDVAVF